MFVCLCACRLLQLLNDKSSASKSFYRLLVTFSWILIRGFAIVVHSGRLRQFILEVEEKVYYKELPFFVKKSCQLHIIFHKMYFKQEYLSSDNIITMVTILVCALTVTKYDLP